MNKTEYLLACLAEECAEVQQAAMKAQRFGLGDRFKLTTPGEDIATECCDLVAIIELLEEEGIIKRAGSVQAIETKKAKVKYYMEYSRERGALTQE
jgi:NTP pyrophosphatase (non-canonical NTP hydrolase)